MSWYRAGSVSVTNGNAVVVGAGTDFVSNTAVGEAFLGPDGRVYEIAQVVSATQLSLASSYTGATAGGQAYALLPTQSFVRDLALAAAQLLNSFSAVRDGVGTGAFSDGTVSAPGLRFSADQDTGIVRLANNIISIVTGGVDRLRIDAAGKVGVGTPSEGADLHLGNSAGGGANAAVTSNLAINSLAASLNDPGGIEFKSSTYQNGYGWKFNASDLGGGNIALLFGTRLNSAQWFNRLVLEGTGTVRPGGDNDQALGTAAHRWSTIFAGSGAINTSDEREKRWRGALTPEEVAAARDIAGSIGVFQFLAAIAEKGEAARFHTGVQAQHVVAIMEAHGLDAMRYAFVCRDAWGEVTARSFVAPTFDESGKMIHAGDPGSPHIAAGYRFGIRYDQLAMFIAAAHEQRLSALEAAAI